MRHFQPNTVHIYRSCLTPGVRGPTAVAVLRGPLKEREEVNLALGETQEAVRGQEKAGQGRRRVHQYNSAIERRFIFREILSRICNTNYLSDVLSAGRSKPSRSASRGRT